MRQSAVRREQEPSGPVERLCYTAEEAAEQLRISRAAIYRLFQKKKLVPSKLEGVLRVAHEELVRYLRESRVA